MDHTLFLVVAWTAVAIQAFLLFLFLFEPYLPYKIGKRPGAVESKEFVQWIETLTNSQLHETCSVEVLTNGEVYYEAEMEAIRNAESSVNLEAFIFQRGEVTHRMLQLLTERARAGVKVNMVLDAVGCLATPRRYFRELCAAGGRVEWYHPFRWYNIPRLNNRTHRVLIVIDGQIGFVGGAGFADCWLYGAGKGKPRWRDTMFRLQGSAVRTLQSVFTENWLEASGEILTDKLYFPPPVQSSGGGTVSAMIVASAPSGGRATRARVLYQTLLASARHSIYITTPYFLPDKNIRKEMIRAIEERGVELKVITPGKRSDHLLTRRSSRRLYGALLKAGGQIYEYETSMIHTKAMIIDGLWAVVGSTNFDHRSFGLNDEVNLVACDQQLADRLCRDFANDLLSSQPVSYRRWRQRPGFERIHEWLGRVLERQQ